MSIDQINGDAAEAYKHQGPGIGAGDTLFEWIEKLTTIQICNAHKFLDVGFGKGVSLMTASQRCCARVCGVDIADAALAVIDDYNVGDGTPIEAYCLDASDKPLPFEDNAFNIVTCTETIEHMANPYRVISEIKRVLEHDGLLVIAFPRPEDNYGYGGGEHAHVYPGFLEQESYEMFMRQMYFHSKRHINNGSSAWYAWRNYKGAGIVDVFHMIAGNYTEDQLYGMMPKG